MEFDTLDYIHVLIGVAWAAALISGLIAILSHRALIRRQPAARLSTASGRWVLQPAIALAALIPAVVFSIVLAVGWLSQTRDFFALVRLGYYQIAAVPALLGMYLLVQSRRAAPFHDVRPRLAVALLLMTPAPICAYASFVETHRLIVERTDVPIPHMKADAAPIRIAVISDLQAFEITDYERSVIDKTLAEKPDLILMPGDFFQCSWRQWDKGSPDFLSQMQRLACPGGAFGVLGDVDDEDDLTKLLAGSPVRLLLDDVTTVEVKGLRVAIAGVRLNYDEQTLHRIISRLESESADVRILLAHRPDVALRISGAPNLDLIVAGHTHGGQIVIPGFGPPITLTHVPRNVAAGGLHEVNGHKTYISRGVGCERGSAPPIRLFCPPELSILTLSGRVSAAPR